MRPLVLALALLLPPAALAAGDASRGMPLYQKHCSQCHGVNGAADGPAALFVLPRPRIFKDLSIYKFRSTPNGELPTDDDIHRVIANGVHGTSMPAFTALTDQDRWDLVEVVKSFSPDFQDPTMTGPAVPMPEVASPQPVKDAPASRERGKQVYQDNKCWQCHGQNGRGNGSSWAELKDSDAWGKNIILPADLTQPDTWRGGATAFDVFRTISTGLNGTPMPAYSDSITVEDRWHLAHYVRSLGPEAGRPWDDTIIAINVDQIPSAGDDAAWKAIDDARDEDLEAIFTMFPNVVEPPRLYWPSVTKVHAQAVYTQTEIALRVSWNDRSESKENDVTTVYEDRDGAIHHGTHHPDQLAVQFPARRADWQKRPYFLFGDNKRGVNLWWWRADEGSIQEMNAKGLGALAAQPKEGQQVQGEALYEDGRYVLLLRRSLATADERSDVQLHPGDFAPISFHAWDGYRGELGARGAMTNWHWLYLEPPVPRAKVLAKAGLAALVVLSLLGAVVVSTKRRGRGLAS